MALCVTFAGCQKPTNTVMPTHAASADMPLVPVVDLQPQNSMSNENWSSLSAASPSTLNAAETTTAEIDALSIRERDGYRQAWWRQNFVPPRPTANTKGVVGTIFHLALFDCKAGKSAFLIKASYTGKLEQGALLYNESRTKVETLDQMKVQLPGSYAESALRFACSHAVQ